MKRTVALAVSALSLAASGVLGFSTTAHAEACGIGDLCLYQHDNFKGVEYAKYDIDMCENIDSSFNNKASSMENRSGTRMRLYDKKNCSGSAGYSARPRSEDKTFRNNGFNDKASSAK